MVSWTSSELFAQAEAIALASGATPQPYPGSHGAQSGPDDLGQVMVLSFPKSGHRPLCQGIARPCRGRCGWCEQCGQCGRVPVVRVVRVRLTLPAPVTPAPRPSRHSLASAAVCSSALPSPRPTREPAAEAATGPSGSHGPGGDASADPALLYALRHNPELVANRIAEATPGYGFGFNHLTPVRFHSCGSCCCSRSGCWPLGASSCRGWPRRPMGRLKCCPRPWLVKATWLT